MNQAPAHAILTSVQTNAMNSPSFPPADDALAYLAEVDWNKQAMRVFTSIAYVVAFVYVIGQRIGQWYYNQGGKDRIVNYYNNLTTGAVFVYDWSRQTAIPFIMLIINRIVDGLFYTLTMETI